MARAIYRATVVERKLVDGTLGPPDAGSFGNPTDLADALLRTPDFSLVGFASPSFDGFAFVANSRGRRDRADQLW